MNQTIQYNHFGGPEVLEMVDRPVLDPGPGEVRVAVQAVGLNPIDAKSFDELLPLRVAETARRLRNPAHWFAHPASRFPRVVGRDFTGTIEAIGAGVRTLAVGDQVLGTLRSAPGTGATNGSLTQHLLAPATDVIPRPHGLELTTAAALGVAAQTACGALRALQLEAGDVIVITAAAGGVGSIATQLAVLRGATVLGVASPDNADLLRSWGALPISHRGDITAQIAATGLTVTTFLDCYGGYARLARHLGLKRPHIATLVPSPLAMLCGARFTGSRDALPGDLDDVAARVANGTVHLAIDQVCPFTIEAVRDAYQRIAQGTTHGKIVITLT